VKLFPTSLVVLLTILPAVARGQEEGIDDEFALLEEAMSADEVKSASKHRQHIFWSPSAITVFTKEQIRHSGANTLHDLLRRVPGFDVYEMKPSFPLVGARALTDASSNLVLVLVDGREALIELAGIPLWAAMTIDLEEIERVEVIRGPGSTLYGANAFAAVVSITTVSDRSEGNADVIISGGEQDHYRLFGRVTDSFSLGNGTLSYSVGLGTENQSSVSDRRDDAKQVDLRSHGYLRYRQGRRLDLSLHAGGSLGAGIMFMAVGDFWATNVLNHYVMGRAEIGLSDTIKLKAQLYHIRFYSDFQARNSFQSLGVWLADIPKFFLDINTVDGQVQLDFQILESLLLTGGGNLRYTVSDSDKLITETPSELRGAGFIHAQWSPWEMIQLTGGIRFDFNSETEGALSPRFVVVLRPWPDHAFRLGYALAFRKPAFVEKKMHIEMDNVAFPEVIDKMRESIGNADLVNEKVHSFEAGWRAHLLDESLRVGVDLFFNIYRDMIYFLADLKFDMGRPDILRSTIQFLNEESRVTAIGGEAEVTWKPAESWTFWGNLGLRRVTDEEGAGLPGEPRLRANLGCRWSSGRGPFVDLALHCVSSYKMSIVDPDNPLETPDLSPLGETLLAVARLGYRLEATADRSLEAGFTVRAPIGQTFHEYPGTPVRPAAMSVTATDHFGEELARLVVFYLRGSF
jgi:outer membrane receptor protein involved in Fe transport